LGLTVSDSDPYADYNNARAAMRETAKWIVSGAAALIIFVVGASTVSSLGSMSSGQWRFWAAIGAAVAGLALCWWPFTKAIAVLRPQLMTLRNFVHPSDETFRKVRDSVNNVLASQLPPAYPTLQVFSAYYETQRRAAFDPGSAVAADALARFKQARTIHGLGLQMCLTEYMACRFVELIRSIKRWPGPAIVAAFIAFAYFANPPKEAEGGKPIAHPQVLDIATTTANNEAFANAKVAEICYKTQAKMIALEDLVGNRISGVLAPRPGAPCERTRLILLADGRIEIP
jgi:hypothetical protein